MGRPTRAQSAAITQDILQAATDLFLRDGFDGTTMEAVAAQVGVPKTTLYKRFRDKGELLAAVIAQRVRRWGELSSRGDVRLTGDLVQRLTYYAAVMLVWGSTEDVRALLQLAAAAAPNPGGLTQDFFGSSEMLAVLEKDIAAYGPPQGIAAHDPRKAALALMAMVTGWLALLGPAGALSPEQAEADAAYLVGILMNGRAGW